MHMLGVEEALQAVLGWSSPLPSEPVPIEEAIGRALCEEIRAVRTLPPWDNSAMDGYAVRAIETQNAPLRLKVTQTIYAGKGPEFPLAERTCARIMTGAPLPPGADAVVPQERTTRESDWVLIHDPALARQHVRDRGEDAHSGEVLLAKGTPLGLPEAGLLWAQGFREVPVPRRPTVAIASTGDELVGLGQPDHGRLIDTNSPSLAAAVNRAGAVATQLGIASDELSSVERLFEQGLGHDLLLTCAGASVGEKDFALRALERLGVELAFSKVAMKPGKPLTFGRKGATLVFALPGNPTSALVCFELFVRPCLKRLLGHREVTWSFVRGRAATPYRKPTGLSHFVRVSTRWSGDELWAEPLASQTSGALRSAAAATHLMVVPAHLGELEAGEPVSLLPLAWGA